MLVISDQFSKWVEFLPVPTMWGGKNKITSSCFIVTNKGNRIPKMFDDYTVDKEYYIAFP